MSQETSGIRKILTIPLFYNLFIKLLGGANPRRELVERYIKPFPGMEILDIGCGTGTILDYLPEFTRYTGIDVSYKYIHEATKKYGHKAKFHCQDMTTINFETKGGYDLVMGLGLLHHLDDSRASQFFITSRSLLKPGGSCLAVDPGLTEPQSMIARSIIGFDRGRYVRSANEYKGLAGPHFNKIDLEIRTDRLKVPYTHFILKCRWEEERAGGVRP